MEFSYIICYRHQPDRYQNLLKTIEYLKSNFDLELILVEQDIESKIPDSSLFNQHIFTYSERPFNRSWAFNVGAKYANSDKLFFGDCDLICPVDQMNDTVNLLDTVGCVSPYNRVVDLQPHESFKVDLDSWMKISRNGRSGTNLTGGIIGFRKDDFYKISGWCEDFESWGGEDDFQTWKVKNWISHESIEGNVYHIYHTPAQIDQNAYRKNLSILQNLSKRDPQEVVQWINNSKTLIGRIDKYKDMDYSNFLEGKTVCIVGPAPHMKSSNYGEKIESYDIIIRLNKAFPIPNNRENDLGKRTDILYNCLNPEPDSGGKLDYELIKKSGVYLSMPYPSIYPFDRDVNRFNIDNENYNIPFHIMKIEKYIEIQTEIKTRPNTGMLSMVDILQYPIKELYVTGFTFFKGGYDLDYRDNIEGVKMNSQSHSEKLTMDRMKRGGNHDQDPQIKYIRKIYKSDDRFNGDDEFEKIMENK